MKYFIKKINLILLCVAILIHSTVVFGRNSNIEYSRNEISNYFSGIVSSNQHHTNTAFKYLSKTQFLQKKHYNYNVQFIRTLVLLEKFKEAFKFSKNIWNENEIFLEVDLLLGLNYLLNKEYSKAEKYFERLNKISPNNLFLNDFLGNFLLSWTEAEKKNKINSFKFLNKIPGRYNNLKKIQNSFLQCYFDTPETQASFEKLVKNEEFKFSRYNFFLINYFLIRS